MQDITTEKRLGKSLTKRFSSGTAAYFVGNLANSLLSILLAPLYTLFLSPADYGIVGLAVTMVRFGLPLVNMGLPSAIPYFYNKYRVDKSKRDEVMGTFVSLRLIAGLVMSLINLFAVFIVCNFIIDEPDFSFWPLGVAVVLAAFGESFYLFLLSYWRTKENVWPTVFFGLAVSVVNAALILTAIGVFSMGATGQVLGSTSARVLAGLAAILLVMKSVFPKFNFEYAKKILQYCLPVLPHAFLMWLLSSSDRLFLGKLGAGGLAELGLYQFAATCAGVMLMVVTSAHGAWAPIFMDIARHSEDAKQRLGKFSSYGMLAMGIISAIGILFSRELIALIANVRYHESYTYAAILIFAYYFQGIVLFVGMGLWHKGKTKLVTVASGSTAFLSVGLNLLLIPYFGALGASWTLVATYACMTVVYHLLCRRHYLLEYHLRPFLLSLIIPASALAYILLVKEVTYLLPVLIKLVVVLLVVVTLLLIEKDLVKQILGGKLRLRK